MATRKPRAKSKDKAKSSKPKISLHLDPERWEEIGAIGVMILAGLTALGAFNLSGGVLLDSWVRLLQQLLGWGVYFAPLLLLALGVWLLLDSLDRMVNIGWDRPIALGILFLWAVAVLQWLGALDNPTRMPGPFQGGGLLGWAVLNLFVQLFGVAGALLALVAFLCAAVILLFNVSLSELVRHLAPVARIVASLAGKLGSLVPKRVPKLSLPRINPARIAPPAPPLSTFTPPLEEVEDEDEEEEEPEERPATSVAAHIVGDDSPVVSFEEPEADSAETPAPVLEREYRLPEICETLEEGTEQEINQQEIRTRVRIIEETLQHFGVPAKVLEVNQGPTITQFGVEPGFVEQRALDGKIHRIKIKVSRITALQHDLELALAAAPIRIEAPVPGRSVVGIEVPNAQVSVVSLRGVVESEAFGKIKSKLRIALGQDVAGQPVCADLSKMPHLLIAGATGSGKSVCINTVVAALLCTATPDEVRFVMIDPKRVELVNYNGIPHLIRPVVVEVEGAVMVLQDAVHEMDRRFKLFAEKSARNIETYNRMVEDQPEKKLPFLVVIVDELADLMMVAASEVEHAITRLAQMARATGIHLILATQRPSVDVVTGLIKANFPARISFAVTSLIDSRVVLDAPGAEKLLGRGDMLYLASDSSKLQRLQGCYVSDRELEKLATHWRGFAPPASDMETVQPPLPLWPTPHGPRNGEPSIKSSQDELLAQAIEVVRQSRKASVSLLQRKLRIGYSRASRLMDLLEAQGVVGPDEGPTKGRMVLIPAEAEPPAPLPEPKVLSPETDEDDEFADFTERDWKDLEK